MPAQVTANSSPAEIEKNADDYAELLRKSGLPADRNKIIEDMSRRAASMQSPAMSVDEWRRMWSNKFSTPAPDPAPTPVEKVKRAAKVVEKAARGMVREIEKDYFYISPQNAADVKTWLEVNLEATSPDDKMHMLAVGPSGCGKTSMFGEVAKQYNVPFYKIDAAAVTSIDRWLGHKDVRITEKGPETTYVMSEFLRWVSADGFEPGMVIIDEITRTPPPVNNVLMSIFDGSSSVWVPELGITVSVHPKTIFGATANIGSQFSGTYALDQALRDRFAITLEVTWPSVDEEVKILVKRRGIDEGDARKLVQVATQVRLKFAAGDLPMPVSTRSLLNAAKWVARGRSIIDAAEATFVKQYSTEGLSASDRTKVQLLLQGVAGASGR